MMVLKLRRRHILEINQRCYTKHKQFSDVKVKLGLRETSANTTVLINF